MRRVRMLVAMGVLLAGLVGASGAGAATTVMVPCDASMLQADVAAYNSGTADETLDLAPSCTYTLTSTLDVSNPTNTLTFQGGAGSVLNAGGTGGLTVEILQLHGNTVVNDVTLTNSEQGAIEQDAGTLTITASTFSNNLGPSGGAILAQSSGGTTVLRSTFTDNRSEGQGGAIFVLNNDPVTVTDSTFSGNEATRGGAIFALAGAIPMLSFSTFAGDTAVQAGFGSELEGTFDLRGDIFAGAASPNCGGARTPMTATT